VSELIKRPATEEELQLIRTRSLTSLSLHKMYSDIVLRLRRPAALRHELASHCCVLAMEYQAAIANLNATAHFAAAHVLIRPTFESLVRGLWLTYEATPNKVVEFSAGKFRPDLDRLLKYLRTEQMRPIGAFIGMGNTINPLFSSFAHSCYEQIKRRQGGFELSEVMASAFIADMFCVLAGDLLGTVTGVSDLVDMTHPNLLAVHDASMAQLALPEPPVDHTKLPPMPNWPDVVVPA